jgi:amphi-Trp domain-containing protein
MPTTGQEFNHHSVQDRESVVKYLNALSDGIKKGRISIRNGGKDIELEPADLLTIEIKAKHTGGGSKLSIILSWTEFDDTLADTLIIQPQE